MVLDYRSVTDMVCAPYRDVVSYFDVEVNGVVFKDQTVLAYLELACEWAVFAIVFYVGLTRARIAGKEYNVELLDSDGSPDMVASMRGGKHAN